MAEVLGTALSLVGAVGVLGQIFTGCINAYSLFTTASSLSQDSKRLICKIRIEEMRLMVWGRELGVAEGRLHLKEQSERLRVLAVDILDELLRTITDFEKLKERYGMREENFTVLLGDLKDYNDGLEQLFPPARLEMLQRTWRNELLQHAERDLGQLSLLEKASSGVYPQLSSSASLKQLRINLDEKPTKGFKPTYALKIQRTNLTFAESNAVVSRSHGAYKNLSTMAMEEVLVESVGYDKEDLDTRLNHVRRIDDLARMIHSSSDRHPDLHTLDCLGYADDTATSRYGLVYQAPSSSSSNLNALIGSSDLRTPDLGDRFQLAHTLAVALWSLHSLDWLHKSLSSSNILFFPSTFSASATRSTAAAASIPDISSPFLLGFDASRPESMGEMSVASKNTTASDLHRHPSSLNGTSRKPYCKSFDVYSLGLVLLEIGLWKVLQMFHKPRYSAETFRDKVVVQNLLPNLNSKTGRKYREVVARCLSVKEDLNGKEVGQLMEYVVGSLESLNV